MISYIQPRELHIRRSPAPEAPFWCPTALSPYSSRREIPLALDYEQLQASATERLEVRVSADPADYLDREENAAPIRGPVFIESTGAAENQFHRGHDIAAWCAAHGLAVTQLLSPGSLRASQAEVTVLSAWPGDPALLEESVADARMEGLWGLFVPLVFPLTTSREFLDRLAELCRNHGASFLASAPVESDPAARKVIAEMAGESDEAVYDTLFHADLEPIVTAAERHLAALAHDAALADHVLLPGQATKNNWNCAALLARTAGRMIRMREEVERAWAILRSSQIIASLDKPVDLVAATARLSIIRGLDPLSVEAAEEWLAGETPTFVRGIDKRWRARL